MTEKFKRAVSDEYLKSNSGNTVEDELRRCYALIDSALEVLEEVALPPYSDSDVTSLLETLRARAKKVLEEVQK